MKIISTHIKWLAIILSLGMTYQATGQELGQLSFFEKSNYIWNPAFTALENNLDAQILFRQQWVGFEGAPRTGYAGFQKNIVDANMGLGGVLIMDRTGPVVKNAIQFNYAYRLREAFGENSMLSLGLSGNISQISFDSRSAIFNDEGDFLISLMRNTSIYPTLSFGFLFVSDDSKDLYSTSYYFGASLQQFYSSNILLMDADFSREKHIYLNAGVKIPLYEGLIQPSININYVRPSLIDIQVSGKYELEDRFWAGIGYSSISEAAIFGGLIIDEFLNSDSKLRIGALGNFKIGSISQDLGPGVEFFLNYSVNIDRY